MLMLTPPYEPLRTRDRGNLDQIIARHTLSPADLEHRLIRRVSRRASESAAQVIARAESESATEIVEEAREDRIERSRALVPGDRARLRGTRTDGTVASIEEDAAWLEIGGKRMRVPLAELERVGGPPGKRPSPQPSGRPLRGERDLRSRPESSFGEGRPLALPRRSAGRGGSDSADLGASTPEVIVIGRRLDEAVEDVEKALDRALAAGRTLAEAGIERWVKLERSDILERVGVPVTTASSWAISSSWVSMRAAGHPNARAMAAMSMPSKSGHGACLPVFAASQSMIA